MWAKARAGSHGVELVDGKHQRMHAQQMGQQAVAAGLGQQLQIGFFQSSLVASTSTTAASALEAAVTMLRCTARGRERRR
jgi:hypothetical protein